MFAHSLKILEWSHECALACKLLHVRTYEMNKLALSNTGTYTLSLLGHFRPDRLCVYCCIRVCVWESRSLSSFLSLSVVSDIRWLVECATSFTVKVPVVLEHNVGEKRGSYDREKNSATRIWAKEEGGYQKSIRWCKWARGVGVGVRNERVKEWVWEGG